MVNICDIMDAKELVEMTKGGYVRVQTHPVYPYNIACYTKQAMFERVWNDVTMNCRGLIYHQETGEVLARPFKKFFNYGEPNAPEFNPDDWVTVYDKVDGSLGIAYDTPDGPAIATKGSFASEQAIHATELLRTKYPKYFHDDINTDLFEIIYPSNRIVLDYGDTDELRYLGSVNMEDGSDYWNGMLIRHWGIPVNHFMLAGDWNSVLSTLRDEFMNRPNSEGVVIHNQDSNERLKLKQEDYIELHKVMTGLNDRQLWEWLNAGFTPAEILTKIPEEMHSWAEPIVIKMAVRESGKWELVQDVFDWNRGGDRKAFALRVKDKEAWMKGALFAFLDGNFQRVQEIIWKQVWEELKP